MLNVKDWLKTRHKEQFEIIDSHDSIFGRKAKRLCDEKIFNISDLVNDEDKEMWVLLRFFDDKINCKLGRVYFENNKSNYKTRQAEINELTKV